MSCVIITSYYMHDTASSEKRFSRTMNSVPGIYKIGLSFTEETLGDIYKIGLSVSVAT